MPQGPGALAADLLVKHIIAGQAKAFFGYGPHGPAAARLQGRLAVFSTALAGPALMAALAAEPFGRLCMRHINRLYAEHVRTEVAAVAAGRFGVRLRAVAADLDFVAGCSLGIALAEAALPGAAAPSAVPPALATALATALGGAAAEVSGGGGLMVAWGPPPACGAGPAGAEPEAVFAWLRDWDGFRRALGLKLRACATAAGLEVAATFAAPLGGRLVAGVCERG